MTYYIADLCSNWRGSVTLAEEMIGEAAAAGFDAVKVQKLNPHAMWRQGDERIVEALGYTMTWNEVDRLRKAANYLGLDFGISVFAVEDVEAAAEGGDYVKVASSESMWTPLLDAVIESEASWMISTPPGWRPTGRLSRDGQGTLDTRLHCIPSYPCMAHDAQLECLCDVRDDNACMSPAIMTGYSDHTANVAIVTQAVCWYDADVVELHWDTGTGVEATHSWTPEMFSTLMDTVADVTVCGGEGTDEAVGCPTVADFWDYTARGDDGYRR